MQKYFISLLLYFFSLPLYALDPHGFYFGGSAIATLWDVNTNNDLTLTLTDTNGPTNTYTGSADFQDTGWDYSVEGRLGGYFMWGDDKQLLTAIELFASPYTTTFKHDAAAVPSVLGIAQEIKLDYTYGAELKQGYFFTPEWLGFLLIGGVETFYQLTTNLYVNDNPSQIALSDTSIIHTPGLRFGGGVEKFWNDQLSLTLQATYTFYKEIENFIAEGVYPIDGDTSASATDANTFDPSAFQISLGINFYF